MLKELVKKTPIVRDIARSIMKMTASRRQGSFVSSDYWERRYQTNGTSGPGSYNRLAEYKARTLNEFVASHSIQSVIEFGSGDGAQLWLAQYPNYCGVDVSRSAVAATQEAFASDPTKRFIHLDDLAAGERAELSLSLDVIYHLVEDNVYQQYMERLFDAATRFAIVYSSNDRRATDSVHVKHRKFTDWVGQHRPDFKLIEVRKNPYPEDIRDLANTSFADFFFFERKSQA